MTKELILPEGVEKYYNRSLYKFIDIKGAIKSLENSNIQFTKPTALNDPLDCHENLIAIKDPNKFKLESYLKILNKRPLNEWKKIIELYPKYDLEANFTKIIKENKESIGVFSMSKYYDTPESYLVWAYYAQGHAGLCIEYQFPPDFLGQNRIMPLTVNYEEELTIVKTDLAGNYDMIPWVLKKSYVWRHEKEVRLVKLRINFNGDNYNRQPIPQEYITKIIFGANSDSQFIKNIKSALQKGKFNLSNIVFEQMKIDTGNFKLTPKPINIMTY
ncbi:DUF2971 domain-containing protein [Labilibaculum euxinus]|uniref:DUF2971 domain-containing protein n=1 Tax=Labilibaculum euxinus TaxID=2686357 RepID=A0A7M4D7C7_9BACT|nr:DUF2971 domain-containing protein [Labilibaculum euxinus]MUP38556.1 DUF2971 domain-containing protein [Labilibaculum euxinus]MVB07761.1 DUF2971 domain-containing protein [Labilibaculum euxinus]